MGELETIFAIMVVMGKLIVPIYLLLGSFQSLLKLVASDYIFLVKTMILQ